jgi:hypothetical protein
VAPVAPVLPDVPVAPVYPVEPVDPVAPVAPVAPGGPGGVFTTVVGLSHALKVSAVKTAENSIEYFMSSPLIGDEFAHLDRFAAIGKCRSKSTRSRWCVQFAGPLSQSPSRFRAAVVKCNFWRVNCFSAETARNRALPVPQRAFNPAMPVSDRLNWEKAPYQIRMQATLTIFRTLSHTVFNVLNPLYCAAFSPPSGSPWERRDAKPHRQSGISG